MHTNTIAHQFGISSRVLEKNLEGVSHEESLVNPQAGGSCLNWVLGHLTRSRNQALALFGQKPIFPTEEFDTYDDNGGKPFGLRPPLRSMSQAAFQGAAGALGEQLERLGS